MNHEYTSVLQGYFDIIEWKMITDVISEERFHALVDKLGEWGTVADRRGEGGGDE